MPLPTFLFHWLPFGRESEVLGIEYLRSLGYRIVASAYRTQDGEVDIIAWDGEVLTFVEVKSRSTGGRPKMRSAHANSSESSAPPRPTLPSAACMRNPTVSTSSR